MKTNSWVKTILAAALIIILTIIIVISAFFYRISSQNRKHKQLETEIVKEKKSLKKASNISEKMFKIVLKYIDTFDEKDKKRIEKLYDDFLEKN